MESVTIHNLKDKTAQEVVNFVKDHLLKQGCKSEKRSETGKITCLYRGPNGTKCAAGCLIPDEDYKPDMEHGKWSSVSMNYGFERKHIYLISDLQYIHDNVEVEEWEKAIDKMDLTLYQ